MRRIIQFPGRGADRGAGGTALSDVTSQISPAWHQWLRHTRQHPPSLTEQSQDLVRQERLKILAAQADARWEAKARIGDAPNSRPALPAMNMGADARRGVQEDTARHNTPRNEEIVEIDGQASPPPKPDTMENGEGQDAKTQVSDGRKQTFGHQPKMQTDGGRKGTEPKQSKEDPWKKARSGPSEEWQPTAWNPSAATGKR